MKALLLMMLLITLTSNAQDAVKLAKGEIAPYSGVLVSNETAIQASKNKDKVPLLEGKIKSLEALRLNLSDQIEYHKDKAKEYRREALKAESKRFVTNIGYFFLGIVLTGVAAKAAIESTR